jgi:two-component system response regulator DesR
VRNELSAAMGKTGARNRADAVRIAQHNGWLLGGSGLPIAVGLP